jgi:hypothetical protein
MFAEKFGAQTLFPQWKLDGLRGVGFIPVRAGRIGILKVACRTLPISGIVARFLDEYAKNFTMLTGQGEKALGVT